MKTKKLALILDPKHLSVDQLSAFGNAEAFLRLPTNSAEVVGWMLVGEQDAHSRLPSLAELAELGFETKDLAGLGVESDSEVELNDLLVAADGHDFDLVVERIAQFNKLLKEIGGGNWYTGYTSHNGDWFIFCGVGTAGRTGHDYGNQFVDGELRWYSNSWMFLIRVLNSRTFPKVPPGTRA